MFAVAVFATVCMCTAATTPGLTGIRNVYLLPMAGSLDQYLANKLTDSGRYVVVTNPELADAVFTDRVGAEFEEQMVALYPPPPAPKPQKTEEKAGEEKSVAELMGEAAFGGRTSTFSRGRGNIFLVDRSARRILWSTYLRPRSTRPDELDRVADQIVSRLDNAAGQEIKRLTREEKRSAAMSAPGPANTPAPVAPVAAPAAAPAPVATPPAAPPPAPAPAPPAVPPTR